MNVLSFFFKTRMRLIITGVVATLIVLFVWAAFSFYAHFWKYRSLYYANAGSSKITYEQRVHRLASGGFDALRIIVMGLRDTDPVFCPASEKLSLDTLQEMHDKTLGKDCLLVALRSNNKEVARSALELVILFAIRAVERPEDGRSMYYNYTIEMALPAVQEYIRSGLSNEDMTVAQQGLQKLLEYEEYQKEDERYRKMHRSLPEAIKLEVKKRLAEEQQKLDSSLIIRCVVIFDETRKKYPTLSEEQLFEVASILGNALELNARYFMLFKNGFPEEGKVIENPGFDIHDTRDNIPDQ